MFTAPTITVTTRDLERLQHLITDQDTPAVERLDTELARAQVVSPREVAGDVVTMNSEVVYEDLLSGTQRRVRVVYPTDADASRGFVSVLAPLGAALLGLRAGQEFDWSVPHGKRHMRVVAVPYQPEASGHFEL